MAMWLYNWIEWENKMIAAYRHMLFYPLSFAIQ